jgi:transposase
VTALPRVTWRTIVGIVSRVVAAAESARDPFAHIERIGTDEIRWKKGRRYIIVMVGHDSGRLVGAARGRDEATLHKSFDALGNARPPGGHFLCTSPRP